MSKHDASQLDASRAEHDHVVLEVLADLFDGGVFEDRAQGVERLRRVKLGSPAGPRTGM